MERKLCVADCVGHPEFCIAKLAQTNDTVKQIFKTSVAIRLPYGTSFDDHNKICREAIQRLRDKLDHAEKQLDKYFELYDGGDIKL